MASFGVPKKTQKYCKNGWEREKSGRPGGMSKPLGRIIGGFYNGFRDGNSRTECPRKKKHLARRPRWGGGSLRAFRRATSIGWWVGWLFCCCLVVMLPCCLAALFSSWLVVFLSYRGIALLSCSFRAVLLCCYFAVMKYYPQQHHQQHQ